MSTSQFRLSPSNLAHIMNSVSERDIQIVLTLASVRYATARQIERIHFTAGTPLSNARMSRWSLTRLTDLHVLARLDRRIGGLHAGSSGHIYRLNRAGQILALKQAARPRKHWVTGGMFMSHTLAVTELYVRCKEGERSGTFTVRRIEMEPACWRPTTKFQRDQVKPDAYIELSTGGYRYHWFIEMDMATEVGTRIGKKLDRYITYRATGREQEAHKVFPGVLFLVPHERRRDQLQEIFNRLPERDRRLFRVALQSEALSTLTGGTSL